jgi:hypothetical protein
MFLLREWRRRGRMNILMRAFLLASEQFDKSGVPWYFSELESMKAINTKLSIKTAIYLPSFFFLRKWVVHRNSICTPTLLPPRPSKIYQNCYFWYAKTPSGNPDPDVYILPGWIVHKIARTEVRL